MRNKKPDPFQLTIAICGILILLGGAYLGWLQHRNASIADDNRRYRTLLEAGASDSEYDGATEPAAMPIPTPDSDTIRIGLATPPPADPEYALLLAINPDFCGWLRAGADIDLPVVHRINDNERYLSVNLEGAASDAGTLFVDGYNRLYPADTLTIIYGHNMNSGEMFGRLHEFESPQYLLDYPTIQFDTLYENGEYVPFSAFYASGRDVDIRQFQPTVEAFNALTDQLRQLSLYDDGIDVRYGDELLVLMTCASGDSDRRFFLVCRRLRDDESALELLARMEKALQ